jgi:hypothetical protein
VSFAVAQERTPAYHWIELVNKHGNKVLLNTFPGFRRANLRIASKAAD